MSTYFSVKALESQRSSGYKNTTYALSELVDNSFDAGADLCRIIFIEKRGLDKKKYIDEILIADNGEGMHENILKFCLQFGGTTNNDIDEIVTTKKIGKFGYGLPNASLSQCPNIQVISWKSPNQLFSTKLHLKELQDSQSIEIPEVEPFTASEYLSTVGAIIDKNHGTIVSWRDCDKLSNTKAETIVSKSEKLLGKLFRYLLLQGKKIEMIQYEHSSHTGSYAKQAMTSVRKNDPLFLMQDTVISSALHAEVKKIYGAEPDRNPSEYYKNFSIDEKRCKPTNILLEDQSFIFRFEWKGRFYEFNILTSYAHTDIQKPGIREGGDTLVGKFYKEKEKDSITFVRAGREISSGNYGFYNQADPRQRWWTVEVSFSPDADELLGVHNNKQGIEFSYSNDADPTEVFEKHTAPLQLAREQLWTELSKVIDKARKEAWKEINKAHKNWELKFPTPNPDEPGEAGNRLPDATPQTKKIQQEADGDRVGQFTDDEKEALCLRLQEKYPKIDLEDISRTIELYDQAKLRGCVLYSDSESEKLWNLTNVGNFLIVLINTNHMFYQNMIHPLKISGKQSSISAIELFISSLAWEEHNHFNSGTQKNTIEEFRSYVGLHLNKYLREFKYVDDEEDYEDKS